MAVRHKIRRKTIRIFLVTAVVVLCSWIYTQFNKTYSKVDLSHRMVEALLADKTNLAQQYAAELGLTKESLQKTEEFLDKVQEENERLREKIKLLDKVTELEETISRLKEKNALIINHMSSMSPGGTQPKMSKVKYLKTIEDVKEKITEQKAEVKKLYAKLDELKTEEKKKKKGLQEERDRIKSLIGNNGYIMRDGKLSPPDVVYPSSNSNAKVDVKFVK